MESIRHIEKDGRRYASFFKSIVADGPRFVSRQTDEFQFGVIERPAGYKVPPHTHPVQPHQTQFMSEFIYVEKGKIEFTIYDEEWKTLGTETLSAGDFMMSYCGGHSLVMLESTRLLEVKQGPYPGDVKAKVFRDADSQGY